MAIPIMAIMAGANLLKGAYDLYQAKKNPIQAQQYKMSPDEIAYNNEIRKRAEQGQYNVNEKVAIDTRNISAQADNTRTVNRGNIIGQGLENSMIANLVNKDVDKNVLREVRNSTEYWEQKNEDSKTQAFEKLAGIGQRKSQMDFQNEQLRMNADLQNKQLVGDAIGGIIRGGVGIYQGFDTSQLENINMLLKSGRDEDVAEAVALIQKRNG
tara:strand:- start:15069 stop:15704 length:636 start_codon:yes stop_codon:yes gene_type:complete